MERNEDYIKGVKYLMARCRENGIDYRKYPWLSDLSLLLSKYNSCYMFWCQSSVQKKIRLIPYCETAYHILFDINTYLLSWSNTPQGGTFWSNVFDKIFNLGEKKYNLREYKLIPLSKLRSMT